MIVNNIIELNLDKNKINSNILLELNNKNIVDLESVVKEFYTNIKPPNKLEEFESVFEEEVEIENCVEFTTYDEIQFEDFNENDLRILLDTLNLKSENEDESINKTIEILDTDTEKTQEDYTYLYNEIEENTLNQKENIVDAELEIKEEIEENHVEIFENQENELFVEVEETKDVYVDEIEKDEIINDVYVEETNEEIVDVYGEEEIEDETIVDVYVEEELDNEEIVDVYVEEEIEEEFKDETIDSFVEENLDEITNEEQNPNNLTLPNEIVIEDFEKENIISEKAVIKPKINKKKPVIKKKVVEKSVFISNNVYDNIVYYVRQNPNTHITTLMKNFNKKDISDALHKNYIRVRKNKTVEPMIK